MVPLVFLLPNVMIAFSAGIAAWQDFKMRRVYDLVWIPAVLGVLTGIALNFNEVYILISLAKIILIAGLLFIENNIFGMKVGGADAIALILLGSSPYLGPLLLVAIFASLVFVAHLAFLKRNNRQMKE